MKVHYQEITDRAGVLVVPEGSKFLKVESANRCRVYYESTESVISKQIRYVLINTGDLVPSPDMFEYMGTYVADNFNYVGHLYMTSWGDSDALLKVALKTFTPPSSTASISFKRPTVVLENDHKGLSFVYRKRDGTTRLVRLSRYVDDVSSDGRQYVNGLDAERDNNFRTFYLDQIVEWARIG